MAERINTAVDDLDATIRDIRASIFELRAAGQRHLRTELRPVVDAAGSTLGHAPKLTITGPVESAVEDSLRSDLLAVLREGLSNVARHAEAAATSVSVSIKEGTLKLLVVNNGHGVGAAEPRGGLRNMDERARRRGGAFQVTEAEGGGTELWWRVPLSDR